MAKTTLRHRGQSVGKPKDDSETTTQSPRTSIESESVPAVGFPNQPLDRSGIGDLGAAPRRHNSISEKGVLPRVCCMAPGLNLFLFYGVVFFTSLFWTSVFYAVTATLTFITFLWISNLALSSMLGAFQMRKVSQTNWGDKMEELQSWDPDNTDVMHIVMLPNYKENEQMLKETLENLGTAPGARDTFHVVLAMEAREGQKGNEKADRLVAQVSHLFADVMTSFHPHGLPGEVAGKSSNTQWAYREALRKYSRKLQKRDLTRVFLTVGDADTLWHPQYFSAMAYQGLMMSQEERSWKMWQPPILLIRNIWSVPGVTRASAAASLIFELAGLANQYFFPAFCFSAYSLTLALASHPEVDGWDVDVIAEDHHMFCKCFFAELWERQHASKSLKNTPGQECQTIASHVEVQPVFLPAVSYLVESPDGYTASCVARFQQARRHMQGVVELGYTLLQYIRLVRAAGFSELPFRTHTAIWSIMLKMQTLHITSTCQCFALIMASVTTLVPGILRWLMSGGLWTILESSQSFAALAFDGWSALGLAQQALAATFGQMSGVVAFYSVIAFVVMADLFEGRYYRTESSILPCPKGDTTKTSARTAYSFVVGPLGWFQRIWMLVCVFADTALSGYTTLTFFAMIPAVLAAWSLVRHGAEFEYVVAAKPE